MPKAARIVLARWVEMQVIELVMGKHRTIERNLDTMGAWAEGSSIMEHRGMLELVPHEKG